MATIGKIFGWILVVMGLLFLAVEIDGTAKGTSDHTVFGFVLGGLCLLGGGLLVRRARLTAGRAAAVLVPPEPTLDARLFRLAEAEGGRITAVEVAAALGMGFDQARAALEELERQGACQVLVNDSGMSVYRFAEFEGPDGKKDVMEG